MATGHWITAKGAQFLMQGGWDDAVGTNIRMGLLAGSQPAGLDTLVEVSNVNFVADLLTTGTGLATECTATGYARQNMTRVNATEDDTNDRSNLDASDVAFGALGGATNNLIVGTFTYDEGSATDATRAVLSVDWWTTGVNTNGGTFTVSIADHYRAVPV